MPSGRLLYHLLFLTVLVWLAPDLGRAEIPLDQLKDLTGRATAVVTLKSRDNFANEFRYDVVVRNQSNEPFAADSLIVVLEQITDLAGHDALDRMEVVGYDGQTADGKLFFRIPQGQARELPPYSESEPATVRLRNVAYTIIFSPSFRVFGRQPAKPDPAKSVDALIQTLLKKGVLSEEDVPNAQPSPPQQP